MTAETQTAPQTGWLIYKAGRGWYRPNAQGYTSSPVEAGRYSLADARSYSHPNGLDGPRDGMSIKHESEVPGAVVSMNEGDPSLCDPNPDPHRDSALAAAESASAAVAELIRFAREGAAGRSWAFQEDTCEMLADALQQALEIEMGAGPPPDFGKEEREAMNQLHGALARFLEGWA